MQKLLFATTALVATAGMAAADVTFGGYARWGMLYQEDLADSGANETTIESRFRLIVTATTESDAGLSFGAQTRLQINEDGTFDDDTLDDDVNTTNGFNQPRFWVSYEGLEVSVGNTQGAFEFMPGMYAGSVGLTGLGYGNLVYTGADLYSSGGQGRQGIDVKYAMGAFSAHLSYSSDEFGGESVSGSETDHLAAFLAYDVNGWTLAAAFQDVNDPGTDAYSNWALTAGGDLGLANVTAKLASVDYSDAATPGDEDEMIYGVAADFDVAAATTVTAYINQDDALDNFDGGTNYGVGFVHDLGGGASVRGGVAGLGQSDSDETQTVADLGVQFSF